MNGQLDKEFKAASKCQAGACVEVARIDSGIVVRDGKDRLGPVLSFGSVEWMNFVDALRAGSVGSAAED
jgi:hypothetical protein